MQNDLIERLRGFALRVSEGINEACEEAIAAGEADNARIAALEADNARLMGLVKEAGEALDRSRQGWENVLELNLMPHVHRANVQELADNARSTLAKLKEATDA